MIVTPSELSAIRDQLGLTRVAFARALGYAGNDNTCHKQIWQMEQGQKPISAAKSRAALDLLTSVETTASNAP